MQPERSQRAFSIRYLCRGNGNGIGQTLGIDHNMALDPRYFLAGVIAFFLCRIGILYALRINDAKGGLLAAPTVGADRANLIFLMPAPAGLILLPMACHSTGKNTNTRYSREENHWAAFAIGSRFSAHRELHKKLHTNQPAVAWFSSWRFPATLG